MARATPASYLLMTLVALALLVMLVAFNLDFGRFSAQAESLLTELLQRKLTIEGPLHLTLDADGDVRLSATGLRLAGTDLNAAADLARIEKLELKLNLWSALRRSPVVLESLSVNGARAHLEQDAAGNNNWTLLATQEPATEDERFRIPVLPESARFSDVAVTVATPGLNKPLRIAVAEFTVAVGPGREVELELDGSLNSELLRLQASSPSVDNLVDLRNVILKTGGHLGQVSFDGDFAVDDLLHPARPTARCHLSGPNAEYLLDILKKDRVTSGPLNITLRIAPHDQHMGLDLEGAFGEFKGVAHGYFSDLSSPDVFDLKYHLDGPDLARLADLLGIEQAPGEPFSFSGAVQRSGPDLVADKLTLRVGAASVVVDGHIDNYPDPNGVSASAQFDLPEVEMFTGMLGLSPSITGRLAGSAAVTPREDGGGATVTTRATLNGMVLAGEGELRDSADYIGSTATLDFSGPTVASLASALGLDNWPGTSFSVQLDLTRAGSGITVGKSQAILGEDRLLLEGTVGDDPLRGDTELKVDIAGPSLAPYLTALGHSPEQFSPQPYRIQGQVKGAAGMLAIRQLVATAGDERISIDGVIGGRPMNPATRLAFDLSSPSLQRALARNGFPMSKLPAGAMSATVAIAGTGDYFALDNTLIEFAGVKAKIGGRVQPNDSFNGSQVNLDISGDNLARLIPSPIELEGLARPFTLTASMRMTNKAVMVEDARFLIDKTRVRLTSKMGMTPALAEGSFELAAESVDLLPLAPRVRKDVAKDKLPMNLQGKGQWSRDTLILEDFKLQLGQSRVVAGGTLKDPPTFDRTNLTLDARLPDLSELSGLVGRELPQLPARLRFKITGKGNEISVNGFTSSLGDSDLAGDFALSYSEVPVFAGELRSKRLDITPFIPDTADANPSPPPIPSAGKSDKWLIPELRLPMDTLRTFQANVTVKVDQLVAEAKIYRNIHLDSVVADGALTLNQLSLTSDRGGNIKTTANLLPTPRGGALGLRIAGDSISFGLEATTPEEFERLPRYDLNLLLVSEGATLRELAAGVNGYLNLTAGKGQVRAGALRLLTNDFVDHVFTALNPFATQDKHTKVNCATILATVEGGKLGGHPALVMSSKRLNIFANADVDLRTEKINLTFNTVPQKGLGFGVSNLINPYIMVTGTLANPILSLHPESTLIQGGAAVATGGLTILAKSFKDRYLSPKDPCGHAYLEAEPQMRVLEAKYGNAIPVQ